MNCLNKIYSQNTRIVHDGLMATMYPSGPVFTLVYDNNARKADTFETDRIQAAIANGVIDVLPEKVVNEPIGFMSEKYIEKEARKTAYLHDARKFKHHRNKETLTKSIEITARRIGDLKPPAWRTVYDWVVEDDQRGSTGEIPEPKIRKQDKRIPEYIEIMMREALDDHLMLDPNPRKSKAYDLFKARYKAEYKIKLGTAYRSTFYNRCNETLNYEWIKRTQGTQAANRYMRCALSELKVSGILDLVQVDAIHPNIYLLDEKGRVLGRPVVHAAIDVYSRSIVGFSIEILKKESAAGVIECLRSSMMPKDEIPYCDYEWPQEGKIHELATDGGKAYTAETVINFLSYLRVTRQTSETRTPWAKAIIERFFWTLRAQCLSTFPGYIPRKDSEPESDKVLRQKAQMKLSVFEKRLTKYIVDFYHHTPHSALGGKTPDQQWREGAEDRAPIPVSHMHQALLIQGEKHIRTLDLNKGIHLKNVRYQSEELQLLHQDTRKKQRTGSIEVECLFNPSDISKITVIDTKLKRIFTVPAATALVEEGMSLAEYNAIRSDHAEQRAENMRNANSFSAFSHLLAEQGLEVDGTPSEINPPKKKGRSLPKLKKDDLNARMDAMESALTEATCKETFRKQQEDKGNSSVADVFDILMGNGLEGMA